MKKCMGCMEDFDESMYQCPYCGYVEGEEPVEVYHMIPGSILAERYIVGKTLGSGGFGVTYVGYDVELKRKVAIKEYLPGEFSTRIPGQTQVTVYDGERKEQFQSGLEAFLDEAKRLAKFQNTAGIVNIYDSFLHNDTAYLVMEFIDGENLREKIKREGNLSLEDTLQIILPIVSALREIHATGIVHRDIAPDNIMIDKEGNVKLIDFGASRFATTTHSKSIDILLKKGYAPVEQYQSKGNLGAWTDVYALAATMYTMLTGIQPQDAMGRLAKDELKAPSKTGAKVSKNIDAAILNAMNLKIEERTQSMQDFEEELLSEKEVARIIVKKDKKDTGKWPIGIKVAFGLLAVAILLISTILIMRSGDEGAFNKLIAVAGKTTVPNIQNVSVEEAQVAAADKKLVLQIAGKEYSSVIRDGYVLEQMLAGGSEVDENSDLDIVISAGKQMIYMPSVEGLMKEAAIALLQENELLYSIEEVESMTAPGAVVHQSVAADEKIETGTEIVLQVSKGMTDIATSEQVSMPDLVKMDYAQAQETMAELGLYLSKEAEVYDTTVAKGSIIFQSVPAGTMVMQGDSITVTVSLGKEQIRVPDVQAKSEADASKALANVGLLADVVYESSELYKKGFVIRQETEAGTLVDIGTTVKIVVSTGAATPAKTPEPTPTPAPKEWSGLVDKLPAGVTSDRYDIETVYYYRSRTKTTLQPTTDSTLANQGWTLENTITEYGDYGTWSDWTENPPAKTDTVDVCEPKTEYNYQYYAWGDQQEGGSVPAGYTAYNSWVVWGDQQNVWTNPGANTDTMQVISYTPAVTQHVYVYYHWLSGGGTVISPTDYGGYSKHFHGSKVPLSVNGKGSSSGVTTYGNIGCRDCNFDFWYYNGQDDYEEVQQKEYWTVKYGSWYYQYHRLVESGQSGWGAAQTESETCKLIGTRTLYQYRERPIIYKYVYSKWSDWSAPSPTKVEAVAGSVEVQEVPMYRYKEK